MGQPWADTDMGQPWAATDMGQPWAATDMGQPWADTRLFVFEKLHFWDFPSRDPSFPAFADELSGPNRGLLPSHTGMKYFARRP